MSTYESSSMEQSHVSPKSTRGNAVVYVRTALPGFGRRYPAQEVIRGLAAAGRLRIAVGAVMVEARPWGASDGALEVMLQHDVVIVSRLDGLAGRLDGRPGLLRRLVVGGVRLYDVSTDREVDLTNALSITCALEAHLQALEAMPCGKRLRRSAVEIAGRERGEPAA